MTWAEECTVLVTWKKSKWRQTAESQWKMCTIVKWRSLSAFGSSSCHGFLRRVGNQPKPVMWVTEAAVIGTKKTNKSRRTMGSFLDTKKAQTAWPGSIGLFIPQNVTDKKGRSGWGWRWGCGSGEGRFWRIKWLWHLQRHILSPGHLGLCEFVASALLHIAFDINKTEVLSLCLALPSKAAQKPPKTSHSFTTLIFSPLPPQARPRLFCCVSNATGDEYFKF